MLYLNSLCFSWEFCGFLFFVFITLVLVSVVEDGVRNWVLDSWDGDGNLLKDE